MPWVIVNTMNMLRTLLLAAALAAALFGASHAATPPTNFGGVGIDGDPWVTGQIVVRQLVTGGPAHLAGIKIGDVITHIDGKPTKDGDFKQMVAHWLRGKAGTRVILTIQRPGQDKPLRFTLTRRLMVAQPKE